MKTLGTDPGLLSQTTWVSPGFSRKPLGQSRVFTGPSATGFAFLLFLFPRPTARNSGNTAAIKSTHGAMMPKVKPDSSPYGMAVNRGANQVVGDSGYRSPTQPNQAREGGGFQRNDFVKPCSTKTKC